MTPTNDIDSLFGARKEISNANSIHQDFFADLGGWNQTPSPATSSHNHNMNNNMNNNNNNNTFDFGFSSSTTNPGSIPTSPPPPPTATTAANNNHNNNNNIPMNSPPLRAEDETEERNQIDEKVTKKVEDWAGSRRSNIRSLISTLQLVLWEV